MLSVSFREKHLLTKTSRSRFHSQMFNHNYKYPRYKETNEHQTNFLAEKVIEPRTLHLYQRYLSFDILNHSLGTTFKVRGASPCLSSSWKICSFITSLTALGPLIDVMNCCLWTAITPNCSSCSNWWSFTIDIQTFHLSKSYKLSWLSISIVDSVSSYCSAFRTTTTYYYYYYWY